MLPIVGKDQATEFNTLSELLKSPQWPKAVDEILLCNPFSEVDKLQRAESIAAYMIDRPLKGTKILDYGCGEGHVSVVAAKAQAAKSVGYDIRKPEGTSLIWEDNDGTLLTQDFEKVKANGPYDIILACDVIDHAKDPAQVLANIRSVASPTARIYLRAHPWISRHGGHLYRTINKAYIHILFTPEELEKLGYKCDEMQRVLYPIVTYEDWIKKAGLKIITKNVERIPVEKIFSQNTIMKNRIGTFGGKFPSFQMEQSFLNFSLSL